MKGWGRVPGNSGNGIKYFQDPENDEKYKRTKKYSGIREFREWDKILTGSIKLRKVQTYEKVFRDPGIKTLLKHMLNNLSDFLHKVRHQ